MSASLKLAFRVNMRGLFSDGWKVVKGLVCFPVTLAAVYREARASRRSERLELKRQQRREEERLDRIRHPEKYQGH